MPDPTPVTPPEPETCPATSTDGHRCSLTKGHPSVVMPGLLPNDRTAAGARIPSVRHITEDGRTFATRT